MHVPTLPQRRDQLLAAQVRGCCPLCREQHVEPWERLETDKVLLLVELESPVRTTVALCRRCFRSDAVQAGLQRLGRRGVAAILSRATRPRLHHLAEQIGRMVPDDVFGLAGQVDASLGRSDW